MSVYADGIFARARSLSGDGGPSHSRDNCSRVFENLVAQCADSLHRRISSWRRNALPCASSCRATFVMYNSGCDMTRY